MLKMPKVPLLPILLREFVEIAEYAVSADVVGNAEGAVNADTAELVGIAQISLILKMS